ncbi:MAG: hypothetical protein WBX81_10500 [Nitrososphaeraceae archaeon]
MNKFVDNKTVITSFLVLALIYFPLFSAAVDLFAQQRSNISITQATALPLVNTEGNQVKLIINYSIGDESIVGQGINAQMGIYDRINGTLMKLSSFPDGFILNNTAGTIQMASTLTDPKIQNISTIITLTNEEKTEKYSNDARSDLDLSAVLPTSLPALNQTLPPAASPPLPPPSIADTGGTASDDDSSSNSDDE